MKSKMKLKLKQNIGMSVDIAVIDTVQKQNRIKNKMKSLNRKMPQRRDNAGAVCNSGMGMLFLCIYFLDASASQ